MKRKTYLFLISVLAMTSGSVALASSMSVDFDLRGYGADVASINLNQGGLSLDITADTVNGGTLDGNSDAVLTRKSSGLGVYSGILDTFQGQVDGFIDRDIALFQFSQDVTIESFEFTHVQWWDDLRLFGVGTSGFSQLGPKISIPGSGVLTFPGLSQAMLTGNLFGIAGADWNDSFRISGLTVSYDAVPIPAALPLMLSGLAGLGLWGRRKKRLAAAA